MEQPKIKVYLTELIVSYDIGNNELIQLRQSSFDNTLDFAILDKEQEHETGETKVKFENIKELENILTDFKNKYNNINGKFNKRTN